VIGAVSQVISCRSRNGNDLGKRISPGFSGLRLDGIENPVTPIQDEIVKPANDPGAVVDVQLRPCPLRFAGPGGSGPDVRAGCKFNMTNDFAGCGISNFDNASLLRP
jgi:hypothetical protein